MEHGKGLDDLDDYPVPPSLDEVEVNESGAHVQGPIVPAMKEEEITSAHRSIAATDSATSLGRAVPLLQRYQRPLHYLDLSSS